MPVGLVEGDVCALVGPGGLVGIRELELRGNGESDRACDMETNDAN